MRLYQGEQPGGAKLGIFTDVVSAENGYYTVHTHTHTHTRTRTHTHTRLISIEPLIALDSMQTGSASALGPHKLQALVYDILPSTTAVSV